MLGPEGQPPRVGCLLVVEDVESVSSSGQDADAKDNDESRNDRLGEVERCRVDLHDCDVSITLRFV